MFFGTKISLNFLLNTCDMWLIGLWFQQDMNVDNLRIINFLFVLKKKLTSSFICFIDHYIHESFYL
jgi:hypothetical protein